MTNGGVRVLREFLYVDSDKVNALLGQLMEGVPEEARQTDRSLRSTGGGARGFAWHQDDRGGEAQVQRSLADANFPELERILESEKIVTDLSDVLAESSSWLETGWREDCPPGSLVRVELRGTLFDARYVAQQLAGYASVVAGAQGMGIMPGKPGTKTQEKNARTSDPQIEDSIPLFAAVEADQGQKISRDFLQAIVRMSKGLFTEGLHLILRPDDDSEFAVTARLEEGRRYLDTSPEILFARYGLDPQTWTLVGSVGHYPERQLAEMSPIEDVMDGTQVSRIRAAQGITAILRYLGVLGFADLPRYPSFSVVPIAVYRTTTIGSEPGKSLTL